MHFSKISTPTAAALLAMVARVTAHGAIVDCIGDADKSAHGTGLGWRANVPRTGTDQLPFQADITVFKDPIVPPPSGARIYHDTGCGSNINYINNYYAAKNPDQYKKYTAAQKNTFYYQAPAPVNISISKEMSLLYERNSNSQYKLPQATAGGYLNVTIHQVNADGAGPYNCRIDQYSIAANRWSPTKLTVSIQIPGDQNSINAAGSLKSWPLQVKLPADLNCQGSYGGQGNICIVRCENQAVNGPFGGCIPFQQSQGRGGYGNGNGNGGYGNNNGDGGYGNGNGKYGNGDKYGDVNDAKKPGSGNNQYGNGNNGQDDNGNTKNGNKYGQGNQNKNKGGKYGQGNKNNGNKYGNGSKKPTPKKPSGNNGNKYGNDKGKKPGNNNNNDKYGQGNNGMYGNPSKYGSNNGKPNGYYKRDLTEEELNVVKGGEQYDTAQLAQIKSTNLDAEVKQKVEEGSRQNDQQGGTAPPTTARLRFRRDLVFDMSAGADE
ncbi:hypothetical protein Dda_8374 [Drechslerella dactyloides]|uniref:Uncharacterized protein n=1 Tax=Drechslerella dactyloides TaxID=74499 RepID=A0AAD6IU71_DREDA|nr:hypothetical protein Dda_8374 [Drechslerella dactyloides]